MSPAIWLALGAAGTLALGAVVVTSATAGAVVERGGARIGAGGRPVPPTLRIPMGDFGRKRSNKARDTRKPGVGVSRDDRSGASPSSSSSKPRRNAGQWTRDQIEGLQRTPEEREAARQRKAERQAARAARKAGR